VVYPNRFAEIFTGLQELPLASLPGRESADQRLARRVPNDAVRQFLLQNLVKRPQEGWQWRFNLPVLSASIDSLAGFPPHPGHSYAGETLFLYGERSDYVKPEYRETIERLFPHARLRMMPGVGHWLYAEQPEAFSQVAKRFLK